MADRLGLAIIPGTGWPAREIQSVAREAEDAGFDAIFTAEVNNDALGTAQLMGAATRRIQVGTWIANIYLRHPYVCAQGAALISDLTGGRLILGLGVSHQPVNGALGIEMPSPAAALRRYVTDVQQWLRGEGPATHLPQRPAAHPVPVHVAALTSQGVELAGELADGVMPFLWSAARVAQSKQWAARAGPRRPDGRRSRSPSGCPPSSATTWRRCAPPLGRTSVCTRRSPSSSGCSAPAASRTRPPRRSRARGPASLSDRLLDAVCLIGPMARCREQLAAFRAAGLDLPILVAPIGVDGARAVIAAFRR